MAQYWRFLLETIAVYWEDRVKVYSINEKSGLALTTLEIPDQLLAGIGDHLSSLQKVLGRFELITAQPSYQGSRNCLNFFLIIDGAKATNLKEAMDAYIAANPQAKFTIKKPVELLYLHGPHFQDRYGIADIAFTAFAESGCELFLSGCAGTSMYLVVPEGQALVSKKILSEKFLLPSPG